MNCLGRNTTVNTDQFQNSICHLLLQHEKQDAHQVYLRQPQGESWREYTWKDVMQQARQVASFLLESGLKKGDHVSIYSKNCAQWFITDFGISLAGMVNVPLFSNQHESSIQYVLEHSQAKLVFVGKLDNHIEARGHLPQDMPTVNFGFHDDLATSHHWSDVLQREPLEHVAMPKPEDLYTIIYSSGTSGKPKGAMYTHGRIANYLHVFPEDIRRLADVDHYRLISYLPLAHVYERSAIQLGSLAIPSTVSFVESLETFADNLRHIQPTIFAAVPRVWGVFQKKIESKISPTILKVLLNLPFVAGKIKHKIQRELGFDKSLSFVSGASHLPKSIYDFFDKLDIPIQEGYGQTENFAYATLSMLDERKSGYVGTPRFNVDIKKGDRDELLMKCPCLMTGYYKSPEAAEESFTEDGWFRTGDIVEIDALQRVKILGRLSENFKNQKGEFIAPTPIEKKFNTNEVIEQLCLVGRELPSNVMLVTLTEKGHHLPKDEIKAWLKQRLRETNHELKGHEKISHVLVLKDEWSTDNDMITPTLKVKRREVESRYQDSIQQVIKQPDAINWQ